LYLFSAFIVPRIFLFRHIYKQIENSKSKFLRSFFLANQAAIRRNFLLDLQVCDDFFLTFRPELFFVPDGV